MINIKIIEKSNKKEDTLIAIEEEITETRETARFTLTQLEEKIAGLNAEIEKLESEKTKLQNLIKEVKKIL